MTKEFIFIEWRADSGEWIITTSDRQQLSLAKWAETQPELASVQLTLSAANYVAHWVALPGVKGRHVTRALPFALEEHLIGDVSDFTVIPSGHESGYFRAYVVATELLDQLLEALELHHLRLTMLVPETAQVPSDAIVRDGDFWLINIPGRFEGRVPEGAMTAAFEYVAEAGEGRALTIVGESLDQARLLQTTLETGHPDAFSSIESTSSLPASGETLVNLLHGRIQPQTEQQPAAWWRSLAVFAGVVAVIGIGSVAISNHQLSQRVEQVSDASLSLYKKWFPNERTSNYETMFRRKLSGSDGAGATSDFAAVMAEVSAAWAAQSKVSINVASIRFSDRTGELLLDVTAKEQSDLQVFKQGLEARGLTAEISSATADKGVIKGRVKIGGAV